MRAVDGGPAKQPALASPSPAARLEPAIPPGTVPGGIAPPEAPGAESLTEAARVRRERDTQKAEAAIAAARAATAHRVLEGLDGAMARLLAARDLSGLGDQLARLSARLEAAERDLGAVGRGGEGTRRVAASRESIAAHVERLLAAASPKDALRARPRLDRAIHRLWKGDAPKQLYATDAKDRPLPSSSVEQAMEALQKNGVPFQLITLTREDGSSVAALEIEPGSRQKGLSKVATRVAERFGARFTFSPEILADHGALGMFSPDSNRIFLDKDSILDNRLSMTGLHEVRHAYFHARRVQGGQDSIFDTFFTSRSRSPISQRCETYRQYQSGEELATWSKDIRIAFREVKSGPADPSSPFPWTLQTKAKGTYQLAIQTQEASTRALRVADDLLATKGSRALRQKLEDTPYMRANRETGAVTIDVLGFGAHLPFVTPEEKVLFTRLADAEDNLAAVRKKAGVLAPLVLGKSDTAAKRELYAAQRAVLEMAREKLIGLRDFAAKLEAEVTPLHERMSMLAVLRMGQYAGEDKRPDYLELGARFEEMAPLVEAYRCKATPSDEDWKELVTAMYSAGSFAVATEGRASADRLAMMSTKAVTGLRLKTPRDPAGHPGASGTTGTPPNSADRTAASSRDWVHK